MFNAITAFGFHPLTVDSYTHWPNHWKTIYNSEPAIQQRENVIERLQNINWTNASALVPIYNTIHAIGALSFHWGEYKKSKSESEIEEYYLAKKAFHFASGVHVCISAIPFIGNLLLLVIDAIVTLGRVLMAIHDQRTLNKLANDQNNLINKLEIHSD